MPDKMPDKTLDNLPALVNADARLVQRGRFVDTTFLIAVDDDTLVRVEGDRIAEVKHEPFITPNYSFALRAPRAVWDQFWQPLPPRSFTDVFALVKQKADEGGRRPALVHGQPTLFQGIDRGAAPRKRKQGGRPMSPRYEAITGRYLPCSILDEPHRLYVEEAGQGIPLLCLHTAGADTRQYRGLMNDPRITDHFRVIAFDMPWHGKTSPPAGWQDRDYKLTANDYMRMILDVSAALEIDRPVAMGCSIGGRIVLHLAYERPERFRALIGLESAAYAEAYYDLSWLNRPDVHGGMVCAGVISGLVAPTVQPAERWETLWHYMQSGPGVFAGDLHFYTTADGDIRPGWARSTSRAARSICSPASTIIPARRRVRSKSTSVPATIMKGLGHFPMSEDHEKFVAYLLPVLEKIRGQ
ncbi:MAG: alpha/beta hydrolase [Pseudolabrys sp.]